MKNCYGLKQCDATNRYKSASQASTQQSSSSSQRATNRSNRSASTNSRTATQQSRSTQNPGLLGNSRGQQRRSNNNNNNGNRGRGSNSSRGSRGGSRSRNIANKKTRSSSSGSGPIGSSSSSATATAVPNCSCGSQAIELTVRKEGANKGRTFFKCGGNSCNFFEWNDNSGVQHGSGDFGSNGSQMGHNSLTNSR